MYVDELYIILLDLTERESEEKIESGQGLKEKEGVERQKGGIHQAANCYTC